MLVLAAPGAGPNSCGEAGRACGSGDAAVRSTRHCGDRGTGPQDSISRTATMQARTADLCVKLALDRVPDHAYRLQPCYTKGRPCLPC